MSFLLSSEKPATSASRCLMQPQVQFGHLHLMVQLWNTWRECCGNNTCVKKSKPCVTEVVPPGIINMPEGRKII